MPEEYWLKYKVMPLFTEVFEIVEAMIRCPLTHNRSSHTTILEPPEVHFGSLPVGQKLKHAFSLVNLTQNMNRFGYINKNLVGVFLIMCLQFRRFH